MTAELRHEDQLPESLLATQRCHGCPHYAKVRTACTYQCETQARDAGYDEPRDYFLFDPLTYTTWRLTRA